ncbi:MAG TPA: hypothetical protein VFC41_03750, partial [Anaerovoracaceae bacterium]|nr:hypothetical protein [Anaerovoracaceae bacterium]
TIDKEAYDIFSSKLKEFLATDLTNLIFINFLRFKSKYKVLFQYRHESSGKQKYISLEKMFEYEHTSKFNISAESRISLLKEIEGDEFHLSPIQGKILMNDIEVILDTFKGRNLKEIENEFIKKTDIVSEEIIHEMFIELNDFIFTDPKIPDSGKNYVSVNNLKITKEDSRKKIVNLISGHADKSELALLTLYVYRQMDKIDWLPFIKAAVERNPVCYTEVSEENLSEVYNILKSMPDESIYDEKRLALPDEVWNFKRGDGIEKALLLADYILLKDISSIISIEIENKNVLLTAGNDEFHFTSRKGFVKSIYISGRSYKIT